MPAPKKSALIAEAEGTAPTDMIAKPKGPRKVPATAEIAKFAFALLVAVGFGMGWTFIVLGLLIRTPTTVMTVGLTFLFPLVFASNIMVDPATMPEWLRAVVEMNPISG